MQNSENQSFGVERRLRVYPTLRFSPNFLHVSPMSHQFSRSLAANAENLITCDQVIRPSDDESESVRVHFIGFGKQIALCFLQSYKMLFTAILLTSIVFYSVFFITNAAASIFLKTGVIIS